MAPSDKKILKQALASLPANRRASLESVLLSGSRDIQASSEADEVATDVSVMKDPERILRHVIRRAREAYVTGCQAGISEAEDIINMASLTLTRHKGLSYEERSVLLDALNKESRAYWDKKSKL